MAKILITTIQVNFVLIPARMRQHKLTIICVHMQILALPHPCSKQNPAFIQTSIGTKDGTLLSESLFLSILLLLLNFCLPSQPLLSRPFDFTTFFKLAFLNGAAIFYSRAVFE